MQPCNHSATQPRIHAGMQSCSRGVCQDMQCHETERNGGCIAVGFNAMARADRRCYATQCVVRRCVATCAQRNATQRVAALRNTLCRNARQRNATRCHAAQCSASQCNTLRTQCARVAVCVNAIRPAAVCLPRSEQQRARCALMGAAQARREVLVNVPASNCAPRGVQLARRLAMNWAWVGTCWVWFGQARGDRMGSRGMGGGGVGGDGMGWGGVGVGWPRAGACTRRGQRRTVAELHGVAWGENAAHPFNKGRTHTQGLGMGMQWHARICKARAPLDME